MPFKRFAISRTLRNVYRKSATRRNNTSTPLTGESEIGFGFQQPVVALARSKKRWSLRLRWSLNKLKFWKKRPLLNLYRQESASRITLLSEIEIDIRSFDVVEPLLTPPTLRRRTTISLPELEEITFEEDEDEEEGEEECLEAGSSRPRATLPSDPFRNSALGLYLEISLRSQGLRHSPHNSAWESMHAHDATVDGSLRNSTPSVSSDTQGEETSDPRVSHLAQSAPADILEGVNRLPNELILKICEFLLFSELEPNLGNHHLLMGVRGVSRKWRALGEDVLWLSLRAPPDLFDRKDLYAWYLEGSKRRNLRDTVSFTIVEDLHTHDTEYLSIFSVELAHCRRADVKLLVGDLMFKKDRAPYFPLRVSNLRHFFWESNLLGLCEYLPSRLNLPWSNLHSCLPWSSLVNLSLKCPLSIDDAYFVLSEGCHTLEMVSLAVIDFTVHRRKADQAPPITFKSLSRVTLNELVSLSVQSYIDLNDLFTNIHLPKISSLTLSILARSGASNYNHDDQLPALIVDLDLNWDQLISFSLESQDNLEYHLGEILAKCDSLQNFKWKGRSSDFTIGSPRVLFGGPRLADNEETFAALRHHQPVSIVELDSFWGRLVNLSLHSLDNQPWPLGQILSKCNALESFKWKGLRSDFSKLEPSKPLRLLKRLVVDSDEEGFSSILKISTGLFDELTAPTGLSFFLNVRHLKEIKSIVVRKALTPTEAAKMTSSLQEFMVARAEFQIMPVEMPNSN